MSELLLDHVTEPSQESDEPKPKPPVLYLVPDAEPKTVRKIAPPAVDERGDVIIPAINVDTGNMANNQPLWIFFERDRKSRDAEEKMRQALSRAAGFFKDEQ